MTVRTVTAHVEAVANSRIYYMLSQGDASSDFMRGRVYSVGLRRGHSPSVLIHFLQRGVLPLQIFVISLARVLWNPNEYHHNSKTEQANSNPEVERSSNSFQLVGAVVVGVRLNGRCEANLQDEIIIGD